MLLLLLLLQDVLDQICNACPRAVRACAKIKRLRSELLGAHRTEGEGSHPAAPGSDDCARINGNGMRRALSTTAQTAPLRANTPSEKLNENDGLGIDDLADRNHRGGLL
jgi:hypothetical protein